MESIWSKTFEIPSRKPLSGEISAQVAVIGAGMAGVLVASKLQKHGVDTVVLEGGRIGSGQTQNTTAKITSQHAMIYHNMIKNHGREIASLYFRANERAIADFRSMVREEDIDCDFEECAAYLYTTQQLAELEKELAATLSLGAKANLTTRLLLPFEVKGALRFDGQARFHPLKFLGHIAKTLKIFENSLVCSVENNLILTDRGRVRANHIVFASHYPFVNLPGGYFLRLHQARSYALALTGAGKIEDMYYGIDPGGLSLRGYGDMVILGGGGHRTGENQKGGRYDSLALEATKLWPGCTIAARWSAQDCITFDKMPYAGVYAPSAPNWYVATGFNKWGMTGSMVAATIIYNMITKSENPFAEVFSPRRSMFSPSATPLIKQGVASVKGLTLGLVPTTNGPAGNLLPGHGGIVSLNGKRVGAYRDEEGREYYVSIRCPHMGCRLEWNADEKSWDCPCHGSRFDYKGELLSNPALKGLKRPRDGGQGTP